MISDKQTTTLLIFIFVAASANYTSAAGFLITNVTTNSYGDSLLLIPGTADKASATIESGYPNLGFNISLKIDDSAKNITGINITFPAGPFRYTQTSFTTSNISVQPGVSFTDISNALKIIITNSSSTNILTGGTGATAYFSFNLNAPSGTSKESSGNKSIYMRISASDQDNTIVEKDVTIYITDTTKPRALRYIQPTRETNSYAQNTTADFSIAFNEPNPVAAILSIGFGNNGSAVNKSMDIIASGLSGEARTYITGLPEGRHNFSFSVADSENNQETNSSAYYITTDLTPPSINLKVPPSNVSKSSSISSSDLTCSATDSLSGVSSPSIIIVKPGGSKVVHTCGNTFSDTSEQGEYMVNFTIQDNAGNYASKTDVFRVSPAQSSSQTDSTPTTQSSSSSSAVNTSSTSNTTSKPSQTISKSLQIPDNFPKDAPIEIAISQDLLDLGLTSVKITAKEDSNSTGQKIEIKILDKIPTADEKNSTISGLQQKLIKAFQFILPGSLEGKIREANITFVLKREEMGDLSPAQIVLMRFSNGNWSELPTESRLLDLKGSVQFTAVTPGFSVFAVTTKSATSENKVLENTQPQVQQAVPEPKENSGSAATGKIISGITDVLQYAGIAAAAAAIGFLIFRRKKLKTYEAAIQKEKKKDIKMYKSKLKKIRDS